MPRIKIYAVELFATKSVKHPMQTRDRISSHLFGSCHRLAYTRQINISTGSKKKRCLVRRKNLYVLITLMGARILLIRWRYST